MTVDAEHAERIMQELYRMLPSVNELLLTERIARLTQAHPRDAVVSATRRALEAIRSEIAQGEHSHKMLAIRLADLPAGIEAELGSPFRFSLRPVINATGVILHTNLGRAPLGTRAIEHLVEVAGGYSNLEFDLDSGDRGKRDVHVERLILSLLAAQTGNHHIAETHRAIIVNNCAAATFLTLHALAKGKEVLVSRGELVEIGGGFRIPEILLASGALLKEIGTTNRTRLVDYEKAISPETALILRVHHSNFSMEGFVERPSLRDLAELGHRSSVPIFEDQGTGLLHPLETCGIPAEPTFYASCTLGCDVIAASGDKLLGGPQCGILVGRKQYVNQIRKNALFRTFRVDKLTYAALEGTLAAYLAGSADEIPVVRLLSLPADEIRRRCEQVAGAIDSRRISAEVVPVEGIIGGGTAPRARLNSSAIALRDENLDAAALLRALRKQDPPIIARIEEDRVLLDLRTVDPESDSYLARALGSLPVYPHPEAND
ncbi:MAG TPA: L-seryl-tRNA(Sec) selenium transferase [Terracidiphilus sp.]|nr:L-seryl-tRNA(Sec) selenium transferase [Terracidiphilus sp.]